MKILVCLFAFAFFASHAFGHAVATHINLSTAAATYLGNEQPTRPNLPTSADLVVGAQNEDSFIIWPILGRFFFHFFDPAAGGPLNSNTLVLSASCTSIAWGLDDSQGVGIPCTATAGATFTTQQNTYRWQDALKLASPTSNPTDQGWQDLGYVVHLLEDLTSPAHTRNDPHPCVLGFIGVCDAYENDNNGAAVSQPLPNSLLGAPDPTTFTTPADFFSNLQQFVQTNFYSGHTVFDPTQPGPRSIYSDNMYFYGACLGNPSNDPACNNGVRKLARKGLAYKLSGDPTTAFIDPTIAHEQFAELSPVTVQYVAAFLKFYAPALTVTVYSGGSTVGTVTSAPASIDCGTVCSAAFVNGTQVTLTANPPLGYSVTWSGDCASAGTNKTVQLSLTSDTACTATFEQQTTSITFVATGDPTYSYAGSYPPTSFPYSYTSTTTTSWSAGIPNYIESSGTFGATSASAHYQGFASCVGNGFNSDVYNGELLTVSNNGPAGTIYEATVTVSVTLTNNILTAGSGSSTASTQNEMYPIRIDGGGTIYNTVQSSPFSMTNTQVVSILAFSNYQVTSVSTAACAYITPPFDYSFTANDTFDITVQVNVTN